MKKKHVWKFWEVALLVVCGPLVSAVFFVLFGLPLWFALWALLTD